jgi:hypothetical protein
MTILARSYLGSKDPNALEDPSLQLIITGQADLKKFQDLLNRSLNCAPEFGADWFKLSDKLTEFIRQCEQSPES